MKGNNGTSTKSMLLKTLLPVLIGIGVVAWMFRKDFDASAWEYVSWTSGSVFALLLALLFTVGRDAGMIWRFRILSDGKLNLAAATRVTLMCEFVSAITPTSAGGSAVSMVFMKREGIAAGRATTLTMTTIMLDELFFVVMCPVVFLCEPASRLFSFGSDSAVAFSLGFRGAFWSVWGIVCTWTALLFCGIFIRPRAVGSFLTKLFSFKPLRRWRGNVEKMAADMESTGRDIRSRSTRWWLGAAAATFVSWTSRFAVVNAIFLAFAPAADQLMVFCRQFVVWTLLTVSPTPGGSGVSEWLFTTYYGDMLPSAAAALTIAIVWRLFSYYIYLVTGAITLPRWLSKAPKE